MASCSGVTASLSWPIAVYAVSDGSVTRGTTLGETGIGIVRLELFQPNLAAEFFRVAPPSLMPIWPNAVLHESQNAWMTGGCPLPHSSPASLLSWCPLGRVSGCGAVTVALRIASLPVCNTAA